MKIKLIRFICFSILAAAMLFTLSLLLRDRETTLAPFYAEEKDTVSVIAVGGSHVNQGIIPPKLWDEFSIAANNVYSWNQPMWASYFYIKEALRTQNPDVILLDLFGMTYGSSYIMPQGIDEDTYDSALTIRPGAPLYEMMLTMRFVSVNTPDLPEYLNLVRYHYRWKDLFSEGFFDDPYEKHLFLRGYGFQAGTAQLEQEDFSFVTEPYEPYRFSVMFLDKTVELAKKKGIELVFVMVPYVYNETEQGIYLWLENYAEQNGISFLNYNGADGERIGIDYSSDFVDRGHMNYPGATKVTRDIGRFLIQNCELPKKSEIPNAQLRDADSLLFKRVEKANQLMLEENVGDYFSAALADKDYSFVLAVNDFSGLEERTRTLLSAEIGSQPPECFVLVKTAEGIRLETTSGAERFGEYTVSFSKGNGGCFSVSVEGTEFVEDNLELGVILYDQPLGRLIESLTLGDELTRAEFTTSVLEAMENN